MCAGLPSTLSFPWLQQAQPAGPCSRLGRARASDNTTPDLASKYARLEMSGPSLVRWPRLNLLEQRLQAPLSSREAILQWGVCMKASAATIEVARRICQRINFEVPLAPLSGICFVLILNRPDYHRKAPVSTIMLPIRCIQTKTCWEMSLRKSAACYEYENVSMRR